MPFIVLARTQGLFALPNSQILLTSKNRGPIFVDLEKIPLEHKEILKHSIERGVILSFEDEMLSQIYLQGIKGEEKEWAQKIIAKIYKVLEENTDEVILEYIEKGITPVNALQYYNRDTNKTRIDVLSVMLDYEREGKNRVNIIECILNKQREVLSILAEQKMLNYNKLDLNLVDEESTSIVIGHYNE